jgi:hypothetical protein
MNHPTPTIGPGPVFLHDFTIYPQAREIYAHNECELFSADDLTIDDLNRLKSDIVNELGEDRASQIMAQLTQTN